MAKDPAFLFYPGDWHLGTMHMTHLEKGCYIDLLMLQFSKGQFTLAHAKHMLGSSFEVVWATIEEKFVCQDGFYWNERLRHEKESRAKFTQSRRDNAKGDKKPEASGDAHAEHMLKRMEDENEIILSILTIFNNVTNRTLIVTDERKRQIKARLKQGYTKEDFSLVISFKFKEWSGDEKMKKHIEPETLFSTKFTKYLEAARIGQKPNQQMQEANMVYYRWSDDQPNTTRKVEKSKAETHFKNMAEGGYIAVIL